MPTSEFLIKREGAANDGDFDDPDADELFEDEWVVIKFERTERPDLKALNTKERIQRATIEMTSSEAQQLMASSHSNATTKLKDFTIKRIIDKGAFGKVFLVENTKDGKQYAMKRLNKDIVLQKN